MFPGELLSAGSLDVMDDVAVGEEAGASSSSAGVDSDDSLPQPAPIPLVESIDEALVPDIIADTTGVSSLFQSAWVAPSIRHTAPHNTNFYHHSVKYYVWYSLTFLHRCIFTVFFSPL